MASLSEMKASSPAYQALTDQEFADKVYQKFYAGTISRDEFDKRTAPKPVDVAGEITAPFAGFNKGVDALINLPGAALNLVGVDKAINYGAEKLGYEPPLPNGFGVSVATQANADYQPQTMLGKAGEAIGEVAGGAILPEAGILARGTQLAARGPAAIKAALPVTQRAAQAGVTGTAKAAALPTVGAGIGVDVARENDLGPWGEMAGGLIGGFAIPNVVNAGARTVAGFNKGLDFANRQVRRARDPERAAYQDIADKGAKAGFDFEEAYREASPQIDPRSSLNRRINPKTGEVFTPEDMAEIVSRRLRGEHQDDIASDYDISGETVKNYVEAFEDANPTPINLVDQAKLKLGSGKAVPLTNEGRNSAALVDDPTSTSRLIKRQQAQSGRVADIIEQSSIEGRNLSEELDRLATTGKAEERAAYKEVADNAQPINLTPVIEKFRREALRRGGAIGQGINDALDRFFKKITQPKRISAMDDVRFKEMDERIAKAKSAENPNPDLIRRLERRYDAMRDDFEHNQNAKPEVLKPGAPIDDVRSFIDARDELSKMTQESMKDGKATALTAKLTELREALNAAARQTNKALEAADAKYSGNRSIERMIERGGELGKKLTAKTRKALREFKNLTPTQQEIQRVAFEDKMAAEALNVKRGRPAADQFDSEAFDKIVETMYPKSAGKEVYQRGQNLLKRLRGEAVTTETARDILSGSRTAPVKEALEAMKESAQAGADIITGRFGKVLENLSNRLARQIGQKAAEHRLDILTETDPARRLPMLKRLADEAKTAGERAAYLSAMKEFAFIARRHVTEGSVSVGAENEANR